MCVFSNSFSRYNTTEKLFTRVSYDAYECLGHLTGQLRKKEIIDSKMKLFQYIFYANHARFLNVHISAAASEIFKYPPISRAFNELLLLLRNVQVHPSLHDV